MIRTKQKHQQNRDHMKTVCEKEDEIQIDERRQQNRDQMSSVREVESENERRSTNRCQNLASRQRRWLFPIKTSADMTT